MKAQTLTLQVDRLELIAEKFTQASKTDNVDSNTSPRAREGDKD